MGIRASLMQVPFRSNVSLLDYNPFPFKTLLHPRANTKVARTYVQQHIDRKWRTANDGPTAPKATATSGIISVNSPYGYSNPLIVSSNFSLVISPTAKLLAIPFRSMI